jgi:hypothetical protein
VKGPKWGEVARGQLVLLTARVVIVADQVCGWGLAGGADHPCVSGGNMQSLRRDRVPNE